MKREIFLWAGLISVMAFAFWEALIFKQKEEHVYSLKSEEKKFLERQLRSLKEDLLFLTAHEKEIRFLEQKGWFVPKNRLTGVDVLEKLQLAFHKLSYTFEPETIKTLGKGHTFKVTKMTLTIKTLFDTDIYIFLKQLLKNFSGILIPREITLTREEEINEKSLFALKQKERPTFISGRLILDWVAMGNNKNEE